MSKIQRFIVAFLVPGLAVAGGAVAAAKPSRVGVMSMGNATDADRATALQAARDNAEQSLICVGKLEDIRVRGTISSCIKIGDQWVCTASASAACIIGE